MHGPGPALAVGNSEPVTYQQLDLRVRAIAGYMLEELQLKAGDRVCLAMKNCAEYAEALLAIWHAGLCAVPVNSKLHPSEVAYIVADSESRVCLSTEDFLPQVREAKGAESDSVRWLDVAGDAWQGVRKGDRIGSGNPETTVRLSADDLAWLFYTSGTTGRPKGVMLTHANLVAMALNFHADMLAIDSRDCLIHAAPMSHGSGLYGIPYWMRGGLQVIPESGGFDEAELCQLLSDYERASLFVAPTMINRTVRHLQKHPNPLRGLRCWLVGGAPFYPEDIRAAVRCFGSRVAQMYGQGETPMTISAIDSEQLAAAVDECDLALLSSVGHAQSTVGIEIVDEAGSALPVGSVGEIVVTGPTVMRGYWRNPGATAQTLVDGGLRTGDLGSLDERGLLHLKGRSKDVIISGGTNVYPSEVEDALLTHPDVLEVAVIGIPDAEWGESILAVVVAGRAKPTQESLDAHCLSCIARFKRPKRYIFVDELPKNPTGKMLKSALRDRFGRAFEPKDRP